MQRAGGKGLAFRNPGAMMWSPRGPSGEPEGWGKAVKREWCKTREVRWLAKTCPLACLVVFCVVSPLLAQEDAPPPPPKIEATPASATMPALTNISRDTPSVKIVPGKVIRADVDLALVNVTVTDPYNRLVTGLEPDNFRVFEDNTEQEIVSFSSEDVPISIGVIFDFSGSMANKVDKAREAALEFFKTANPQDEFFLVSFNERAELT